MRVKYDVKYACLYDTNNKAWQPLEEAALVSGTPKNASNTF